VHKLLIVDDESRILRFLQLKLKLSGFDVVTATSGEEALRLIESAGPELVVLDILMPGTDGFEVLRRLRAFSNVPVIATSAKLGNEEPARSLGASDYLAKPFDPGELIARINTLLPAP
jgi:two-component system KDP operon response regulator KdpE